MVESDGAGSDGAGSDGAGSDGAGSDGAGSDGAGSGGAGGAGSGRAGGGDGPGEAGLASRRVQVVLAGAGRQPRRSPALREIEEQTGVGEVLVRGLIRAQLALALRLSFVVACLFGVLPALFALAPGMARAEVLGIALPWLLLGVLAYPVVVSVALVYVRLAERNERDFAELVDRS